MTQSFDKEIREIRAAIRREKPLIHCITNPISINQCANTVLAAGARPIMAEHPEEVQEITESARALVLNLGNITDVRMTSMRISAEAARSAGIPVILDLVGIACSALRRRFAVRLIQDCPAAVIKGNYSEILALYRESYRSSGVDAEADLSFGEIQSAAVALARSCQAIVLATGQVDIVTDGASICHVGNGTPQLSAITGTGCMLTALTGCFLAASVSLAAVAASACMLGYAGELSETPAGSGTFQQNLFDHLSTMTDEDLIEHCKIEFAEAKD